MTVRTGMARVGRIAAIAYALLAIALVGIVAATSWDQMLKDQHPKNWVVATADGRRFAVAARYEFEAQERANDYARTNRIDGWPADGDLTKLSDAQLLAIQAGKRGDTLPIKQLAIERYAHPKGALSVVWAAAMAAAWCGLAYIALWAVFRALRWIALGFMEKAT
jgi:hypothetical protein